MTIIAPKRILEVWAALIGLWGSSYLTLLEALEGELGVVAESIQWPLVIIGATGTGSVIYSSWREAKRRQQATGRLTYRGDYRPSR